MNGQLPHLPFYKFDHLVISMIYLFICVFKLNRFYRIKCDIINISSYFVHNAPRHKNMHNMSLTRVYFISWCYNHFVSLQCRLYSKISMMCQSDIDISMQLSSVFFQSLQTLNQNWNTSQITVAMLLNVSIDLVSSIIWHHVNSDHWYLQLIYAM